MKGREGEKGKGQGDGGGEEGRRGREGAQRLLGRYALPPCNAAPAGVSSSNPVLEVGISASAISVSGCLCQGAVGRVG